MKDHPAVMNVTRTNDTAGSQRRTTVALMSHFMDAFAPTVSVISVVNTAMSNVSQSTTDANRVTVSCAQTRH